MYPVMFNTSASVHGSHFVRLPEEMNGPGCFGSVILRVLAGAGHVLRWPSDVYAEVEAVEEEAMDECGCVQGEEATSVLDDMSGKLNR